ncbi:MAG: cyclic nucleotide-binding domain-containing protein [Vicinamibacteria bacterium]|jgi:hypothetical protein|nr:cyclic nucleotide-binding domain-containing protein [Vicinamibacteria bacterium]
MATKSVGRAGQISVSELIARRNYPRAIEMIRAALMERRGDARLRVQLGETLILTGRVKEGCEILEQVADDLALQGASAKAIAALKKIQAADPGRTDVAEKLSYLITQQEAPTPDPWTRARKVIDRSRDLLSPPPPLPPPPEMRPLFPGDMEEVDAESASTAPAAKTEDTAVGAALKPKAVAPVLDAPVETQVAATPDAAIGEEAAPPFEDDLIPDEVFRDELVALIEDVFTPQPSSQPDVPRAAQQTPLFKDFTREELVEIISGFKLRLFDPGEIIVSEGEPGTSLFVLTLGMVRAYVKAQSGRQVCVRLLGEGDFFGEISLLKSVPRTATITAAGRCELLEIDRATLDEISQRKPRVWSVLKEFYDQRAGSTIEAEARRAL